MEIILIYLNRITTIRPLVLNIKVNSFISERNSAHLGKYFVYMSEIIFVLG